MFSTKQSSGAKTSRWHSQLRFVAVALLSVTTLTLASCAPAGFDTVLPDDPTQEGIDQAPPLTKAEQEELESFVTPDETESVSVQALSKYNYVDPNNVVPNKLLDKALAYYDTNKSKLKNPNYLTVINFAARSSSKRMFVINMKSGSVWAMHMAHGTGSDTNHDGYAERFSNTNNSKMSSLGFYRTAETYNGSNGFSLRLDGLSSTNSRARERAIVVHGASYVSDSAVKQGRSWGCPAVSNSSRTKLINAIKGGSLIYAGK